MIPTHSVIQYKKYDHAYSGKVPSDTDISAYCRYYINEEYPLVLNVVYCRRVVTTGGGGGSYSPLWSCSRQARGLAMLLLHKGSNHSGASST